MNKFITLFVLLLTLSLGAQDKIPVTQSDYENQDVEMADELRKNGKIYVVVSIVFIIMAGLLGYTIYTDRKITRLEKSIDSK